MCSKCYKDHCIKEQQMEEAHLAMEGSLNNNKGKIESSSSSSASMMSSLLVYDNSSRPQKAVAEVVVVEVGVVEIGVASAEAAPPRPNRCGACRKRVGLTGFKCRCGITYCGTHRYPEQHGCSFDYKAMGKEAIAKANPIVKAEKLDKI